MVSEPTRQLDASRQERTGGVNHGPWSAPLWSAATVGAAMSVAALSGGAAEAYRLSGLLVVAGASQLSGRGVLLLLCVWIGTAARLLSRAHPGAWLSFLGWGVAVAFLSALCRWYASRCWSKFREASRCEIEEQLRRVRDAAESYRLLGEQIHQSPPPSAPAREMQLVHSSVQRIEESQDLRLTLLRQAIGLRTVAMYWLNATGERYVLQGVSSTAQDSLRTVNPKQQGIFAAVSTSGHPTLLRGSNVRPEQSIYDSSGVCGELAAVPVLEGSRTIAVLVAEGEKFPPTSEGVLELLQATAQSVVRSAHSERLFLQLDRTKTEQGKLYQAADELSEARTEAEVIRAGVSAARRFARFDFAAVTVYHPATKTHEICAASGELSSSLIGEVFGRNGGLVAMAVENRHALPFRGEYEAKHHVVFDRRMQIPELESLIVLPLVLHEEPLGSLILGSREVGTFAEQTLPTLEVLVRHVAVSLANARMVNRLEELATTDGMTGLYNKRALTSLARQKIKSSMRFTKPISVIVGDIDHFKRVNDTYGHDVGDEVIKGFGDVLRRCKRETDVVGRFGGEEFVVVCEETDAIGAQLLAERIREELSGTVFYTPQGPFSVTCSLGVASFPDAGSDWESIFKATDEALYVSKRGGRDRVSTWTSDMRGAAA